MLHAGSRDYHQGMSKLRDSLLDWTEGDPLVIPAFRTLPQFLIYRESYKPIIKLLCDRWQDAENVGKLQENRDKSNLSTAFERAAMAAEIFIQEKAAALYDASCRTASYRL